MAAKKKRAKRSPRGSATAAVQRVLAGEEAHAVAKDTGVNYRTIQSGLYRARKNGAPKAGLRQGKVVALAKPVNGGAPKNPHAINIEGLRAFCTFEVQRLLPEVVAAEMSKRFGGRS